MAIGHGVKLLAQGALMYGQFLRIPLGARSHCMSTAQYISLLELVKSW